MQRLSDTEAFQDLMAKIAQEKERLTRLRAEGTLTEDPSPPPPECPVCLDRGSVQTSPDGALIMTSGPCPACEAGRAVAERRRRRLLGESGLEAFRRVTFDRFPPLPGQEALWATAAAWAENPSGWLWLHGQYHTGKSKLALAVANRLFDAGRQVWFRDVPAMLDELRATYNRDREDMPDFDERFEAIRDVDLLVLDDLGQEQVTTWVADKRFQLLSHRMERALPTVVTTNWPMERLHEEIPRMFYRVRDPERCTLLPFLMPPIDKGGAAS